MPWDDDQQFEAEWWGDCANTYGEETKQIAYARRMGLEMVPWGGHWPTYDLGGRSVVDLGGGAVSMLLKCVNLGPHAVVVDPLPMPGWVTERYTGHGVRLVSAPAEEFRWPFDRFDEAWIYNCLQHVIDPAAIVTVARTFARTVRFFEWVGYPPSPGHPHQLEAERLRVWMGGAGEAGWVEEGGAVGNAFFGVASGIFA